MHYETFTQKFINFRKFYNEFMRFENEIEKINYKLIKNLKKKFNNKLFNK